MLKCRSSQSVSSSSCTLRRKVRALVRNRFFATCWVMVEPPCTTRPRVSSPGGAGQADRIEPGMVPEAPVLHRDRGRGQVAPAYRSAAAARPPYRRRWRRRGPSGPQREAGPARRIQRGFRARQVAGEPQQHAPRGPARPIPPRRRPSAAARHRRQTPAAAAAERRGAGADGVVREQGEGRAASVPA